MDTFPSLCARLNKIKVIGVTTHRELRLAIQRTKRKKANNKNASYLDGVTNNHFIASKL